VDDDALKDPQLRGLRERGLGIALKFYTGLQESLEADLGPQSRGRLSEAYDRLGRLHAELGAKHKALEDYRRALRIRGALAAAEPAAPRPRAALVDAQMRIGWTLRDLGDLDGAIGSMERSVSLAEALANAHPDVPIYKESMAMCLGNL